MRDYATRPHNYLRHVPQSTRVRSGSCRHSCCSAKGSYVWCLHLYRLSLSTYIAVSIRKPPANSNCVGEAVSVSLCNQCARNMCSCCSRSRSFTNKYPPNWECVAVQPLFFNTSLDLDIIASLSLCFPVDDFVQSPAAMVWEG